MRCLLVLLTVGLLSAGEAGVRVVATVPVLADLARMLTGPQAGVRSLVPVGSDPHLFQPTAEHLRQLAGVQLVVANGGGLDPWIDGLLRQAGFPGQVVRMLAEPDAHDHDHDHDHDVPHPWHDVRQAQAQLRRLALALDAADPAGAPGRAARLDLALARLGVLDAWVRRQVATIPPARRLIVTPHAGLAAYAAAYGFELRAVEGVATGQEADLRRIADLAAAIRQRGIATVFAEDGLSRSAVEAVAAEAGVRVGGVLATCGPAAGDDYEAMVVANTLLLVNGLR
jgi:zinc/manganese transport system substrate-binding protein